MPKCVDQDFPCQNPNYTDFDNIATSELYNPPSASDIVNASDFCTLVPLERAFQLTDLTYKDYFKGLRNKTGVYHLWIDYDDCDDHDTHTMLCVYVGKGLAEGRVNDHIKKKWPDKESLYVTFYECSNRIAKYIEQLFLDTYKFYLNKQENTGTKNLFAVWDNERHLLGTELHAVSNLTNINDIDGI
ncbi:hypothetical protein [Marinobacter sp. F4206]|uniref:hypothetical protein n=1 Tax=Marinobacter sp. F4206 TaxID=2861777 RepID=UPI001C5FDFB2|nr:hypothetical protein [Marinobacter sp. F4206]MBW4936656.1 hypothetical protein [Marinobacter sp. F4206]